MTAWIHWGTITRPNDTTAYAAGDVIGTATGSTAAQTLAAIPNTNGTPGHLYITSARLIIYDSSVISGEGAYRLHLYSVLPGSAYGDNAAWDLPSTGNDRAGYEGYIDFGTVADVGTSAYVQADGLNHQVYSPSGLIYAYLVTQAGYTPTANRVYGIELLGAPL